MLCMLSRYPATQCKTAELVSIELKVLCESFPSAECVEVFTLDIVPRPDPLHFLCT